MLLWKNNWPCFMTIYMKFCFSWKLNSTNIIPWSFQSFISPAEFTGPIYRRHYRFTTGCLLEFLVILLEFFYYVSNVLNPIRYNSRSRGCTIGFSPSPLPLFSFSLWVWNLEFFTLTMMHEIFDIWKIKAVSRNNLILSAFSLSWLVFVCDSTLQTSVD